MLCLWHGNCFPNPDGSESRNRDNESGLEQKSLGQRPEKNGSGPGPFNLSGRTRATPSATLGGANIPVSTPVVFRRAGAANRPSPHPRILDTFIITPSPPHPRSPRRGFFLVRCRRQRPSPHHGSLRYNALARWSFPPHLYDLA